MPDTLAHSDTHPDSVHANSLDALCAELARRGEGDITLEDVLHAVGGSTQPPLLLTLALPMCVPMPPGIPTLAGALISLTGAVWLVGRAGGGLPAKLAQADVSAARLGKWVGRVQRVVSPLSGRSRVLRRWEKAVAALLVIALGIAMLLPIPLMNIPQAMGVVLIALGALDSSPRLLWVGNVFAGVVLAVSAAVSFGIIRAGGAALGM